MQSQSLTNGGLFNNNGTAFVATSHGISLLNQMKLNHINGTRYVTATFQQQAYRASSSTYMYMYVCS